MVAANGYGTIGLINTADILHKAGLQTEKKAREVILHLAAENEVSRTRSSFFDTHPVGPERLAQFDNAIKEVMSNPGTPGQ